MVKASPIGLSRRLLLVTPAALAIACGAPEVTGPSLPLRRGQALRYALEVRGYRAPSAGQGSQSPFLRLQALVRHEVIDVPEAGGAVIQLTYEQAQAVQDGRTAPLDGLTGAAVKLTLGRDGRVSRIDGQPALAAAGVPTGYDPAQIFQAAQPILPRPDPPPGAKWGARVSLLLGDAAPQPVVANYRFDSYAEGSGNQGLQIEANVTAPLVRPAVLEGQQVTLRGQQYVQLVTIYHASRGYVVASQGAGPIRLATPSGQLLPDERMEYELALQRQ